MKKIKFSRQMHGWIWYVNISKQNTKTITTDFNISVAFSLRYCLLLCLLFVPLEMVVVIVVVIVRCVRSSLSLVESPLNFLSIRSFINTYKFSPPSPHLSRAHSLASLFFLLSIFCGTLFFYHSSFHFISTKRIGTLHAFPIKWCKWNALNAYYSPFMDAHIKCSAFFSPSLEQRHSQWKLIIFEVLAHELNARSDSFI